LKRTEFKEFLSQREFVILDGGMGTMLQSFGMNAGDLPERENLTHPERVSEIARLYSEAGSDIIYTNTFGASNHKLAESDLRISEVIPAAIENARRGAPGSLIALDIGPLGIMTAASGGTADFDEAYEDFREIVIAGKNADLIVIETMSDLLETKAAILATKEHSELPIIVTMTFEENARTFTGTALSAFALTAEGLGVDAIGINCSLGPREYARLIPELSKYTNLPIIAKANAGLPDPETSLYSVTASQFAEDIAKLTDYGVKFFGGCCGTSPEFIKELKAALSPLKYKKQPVSNLPAVCSASKTVLITEPRIIGERINPTGKKALKEALIAKNTEYIIKQAIEQESAGADILDVNVSVPGIDEREMMIAAINAVQGVTALPLQIDSGSPTVLEAALRVYVGKPIVNSVNGEESSLQNILPLVKKYGAAVVGLTLDEDGIPKTAEKRFEIAKKILDRALSIGIKREDVYIDCLTLTASAEQENVAETLFALRRVKEELGLRTVLGVSNVSFGLPAREMINSRFLTMALFAGLDLPIINPNIAEMTASVRTYKMLMNIDKNAVDFVAHYGNDGNEKPQVKSQENTEITLPMAIQNGLKAEARELTKILLETNEPLTIVDEILIPALDKVGIDFESGKIFLPQLIMSAGVVTESFNVLRAAMPADDKKSKGTIVIATVKGDVHDIGKNIVRVLLENYGYSVIDLGKDVPPEKILEAARESGAKLVGLSALMTTTLPAMAETIALLHENKINCKTVVGGAVLTADFAEKIGADFYAKDAKQSADIARMVYGADAPF
jgi:5-methyltetrahydrofolate--homocysteine methyltransferase